MPHMPLPLGFGASFSSAFQLPLNQGSFSVRQLTSLVDDEFPSWDVRVEVLSGEEQYVVAVFTRVPGRT